MSVVLAERIDAGVESLVTFETALNGNAFKIAVRANVVYSIFSGTAFRTGFMFDRVDEKTSASLRTLYKMLFI